MAAFATADDFVDYTVDKIVSRQGDRAPSWRTPADNLKEEVVMKPSERK